MLTAYIIVYKKDGYIGVIKTMKYKILEDFENYEEVEQDVISLYKNKIPKKLLDIWKVVLCQDLVQVKMRFSSS